MHHDAVGAFLIVGCNIIFWYLTLRQKKKSDLAYAFFGWSFFIALWALGYGITLAGFFDKQTTLICNRYCQAMATLIGPFFFRFAAHTIYEYEKFKKLFYFYLIFGVINAAGLFFTPLYVKDLWSFADYTYQPLGGPLYILFAGFFIWCTIHAFLIVMFAFKGTSGLKRKQLVLWLWATGIAYFGGVTLFLQGFQIQFPSTGVYLILAYVIIIGYSVLKYKYMDVELIIKKTLVFAGLFAVMMGVVALVTTLIQDVIGRYFVVHLFVPRALSIIVAILLYEPTKNLLVNLTDKYLFQKKFDYKVLLKQSSQEMAAIKSLGKLSKVVVAFLLQKARIKNASIFVGSDAENQFVLRASRPPYRGHDSIIGEGHPLVRVLKKLQGPVDKETLKQRMESPKTSAAGGEDARICVELMDAFRAEVAVPSFLYLEKTGTGTRVTEPRLRSILLLGPKKSDEPYSQEDLDVFFTIAQESAIAVENARLYDEAIEKTQLLVQMNKELANANDRLQVTQASLIVAEKNATMVGMAKAIGHEINNPLTSVILPIEKISREYVRKCRELLEKYASSIAPEDFQRLTKMVADIDNASQRAFRSANRINAVVHTLTNILKESKGGMESLSLIVLCREAMEATRFSTYEENLTGCDIELEIVPNVMVMGNLDQLLQVFVNLIKNAYEAMLNQKDRKIVIKGDFDPDDPRMARIEFKDNGPGIPPDVLSKIWMQGFSTKIRKDDSIGAVGQGQGLFICKHMIESLHKGTITAESRPGEGTTFIIKLMLAETEMTSPEVQGAVNA